MTLSIRADRRQGSFTLRAAFAAPTAGVTAIFGPSGAGKSTLLAAVAGLLPGAEIVLDGTPLHTLPPERRRIGFVFQEARLFPHLSVQANLLYGARRRGRGTQGLHEIAALLDLAPLLGRSPRTLSGGERQRVAIGRALLADPLLLLLDEPLASLDAARRDEILPYLARLRAERRLPMLLVTHSLAEVQRLADWLVLLDSGQVTAEGPTAELAARADLPLARRDDAAGIIDATLATTDPARGLSLARAAGATLAVPPVARPPGTPLRLRVPAREIIVALARPEAISVSNILPARVEAVTLEQEAALITLRTEAGPLPARLTRDAASRLGLAPGTNCFALIKAMSVEAF